MQIQVGRIVFCRGKPAKRSYVLHFVLAVVDSAPFFVFCLASSYQSHFLKTCKLQKIVAS